MGLPSPQPSPKFWEREQENVLSFPAPLLPKLGEAARALEVSSRLSETRQGLVGDEGEGTRTISIGFELLFDRNFD
jgi:hypothetical protein